MSVSPLFLSWCRGWRSRERPHTAASVFKTVSVSIEQIVLLDLANDFAGSAHVRLSSVSMIKCSASYRSCQQSSQTFLKAIDIHCSAMYSRHMNKTAPFSMRLEPDLKALLQRLANQEGRSLTNYIEKMLTDHAAKHGKRKQ